MISDPPALTLRDATLGNLPPQVGRPIHDRSAVSPGIVHFGPGAFHRAHQAWYLEHLLPEDPRWGICGVSLRSPDVRDLLAPQDNLYTLVVQDEPIRCQVIGAIREMQVAPENPEAVLRRLSAPTTHIVTLTITEKGYCLGVDGTPDGSRPEVRQDRATPQAPASACGYLVEGLRRRREAGLPPFTVISCDNLPDNGVKLARAVVQLAQDIDEDLARWIEGEVRFPRTMVDSITPATTPAVRETVHRLLGMEDRWPVQREPFVQWVIEEHPASTAPDWAAAGVVLTNDVTGFERAKLRLLNATHSTLAYIGSLMGLRTVSEAIANPTLGPLVEAMMREDVAPLMNPPRDLDVSAYIDAILRRFRNPHIEHRLSQIAWDGSQKLPVRIVATLREALAAGRPIDRLCLPIAAWMRFVRRAALRGETLDDPLAPTLLRIGAACEGRAARDVPRFFALGEVFPPDLRADERFVRALSNTYDGEDSPSFSLPSAIRHALRNQEVRAS